MNTMAKFASIVLIVGLFWVQALCQTVDARGPIHETKRRVAAGHSGSIGRRLAVALSVEVGATAAIPREPFDAEFVLENSGKDNLVVPVSPNPGDFEPKDPSISYSVKHLSLFLTFGKRQAPILWGAQLYGSPQMPGTLVVIAPGKSLRVLARIAAPAAPPESEANIIVPFVAHAILNDETIQEVNGKTLMESVEIGSATSAN